MQAEDDVTMTRTGPGTRCGALMRRYWQPVALSEELAPGRPLVASRLLGEDLVVFRNPNGTLGLVQRACAHRAADLAYGRLEDGGLRCHFHGWLFGADGNCLEVPAEPVGSPFASKVRIRAYPVRERNGVLWGYLGPGAPPELPSLDCFAAPEAYTFAFKGYLDCNWLQALEVGIDPVHASYLHRFETDEDAGATYGLQFRGVSLGSEMPMTKILRECGRPEIISSRTDYGQRIVALRVLNGHGHDGSATHVRITHQVFPHGITIPLSPTMTITQWHVPIDDVSCYWYAMFTNLDEPVDRKTMRRQRVEAVTLPDYKPVRNRANGYGFDPREQRLLTYTGLGQDINVHDQMAVEGQGRIHDRTRERLARSDRAIITYRRMLLEAIAAVAEGGSPELLLRVTGDAAGDIDGCGPIPLDAVGPTKDWQQVWGEAIAAQRAASPWAKGLTAALRTGPAGGVGEVATDEP